MIEPAPGFVDVHGTVEGVASCWIRGEQVAKTGSGEAEFVPRPRPVLGEA
jgi:hypothetical protein